MKINSSVAPLILSLTFAWASLSSCVAAQAIPLGVAQDFAVLGGSTVTNTGPSVITGELGVSPGTAVTGFPPGMVTGGVIHSNDAVAAQAHADASTAFTQLGLEVATTNLTGQNLGGLVLMPGIYRFNSNAQLTGTLSLDTGGDPNAAFHFQIGSDLTTASNSAIVLLNGNSTNIFWQIGTSATLGTDSQFAGTIVADQSITLNTRAALDGRALAINGAVTLDSNRITRPPLPAPDLSIAYTDGVAHIGPGGTLVFTLTLTNPSATDATHVSAAATLSSALVFTGSADGGTFANGSVTFSNLTVPANSNLVLQFNAAVVNPLPAGTPPRFNSTATVSTDPQLGADPNPGNNSATVTNTLDVAPDMAVCSVNDNFLCAAANGLLTYVLTVCNVGNIGTSGVLVRDTIPAGTTFVSADQGGTIANGVVTWPAFNLAGGGTRVFRSVTVRVNSPVAPGTTSLINTASVTDDGSNGADINPANNTASDTDCILRSADLAVLKTADVATPNIGDTVVYTVTVTNNGPDSASNVTVTDALPAGLTLIAVTQTSGMYDTASGLWTVGALANAGSARLTITASVNDGAPARIDNTACAANAPEADPNSANNCATVTIMPSCARRPVIVSGPTSVPPIPAAGVAQTFSVITGNNGSNSPVVVTWDFGDGATGTGATVQHTFPATGVYTVKVTVVNACGGIGVSASIFLKVGAAPFPLDCTLLRANLNLARSNSDSLSLLTQLNLPSGLRVAGQRISVQINDMNFSAMLDAKGYYKDSSSSVETKPLGSGILVVVKLYKRSLRSGLLSNRTLNAESTMLKDTPILVQIGNQTFAHAFDVMYTVKKSSGLLTK